jgi:SAM-dependent methyltransferase
VIGDTHRRFPKYFQAVDNRRAWEDEADNWVKFARTPGHDAYWHYRDSFFDKIVPKPGRVTLEVGSGEGRVTRDLMSRGHRVVSLDGSPTLLRHAIDLDPTLRYGLADAVNLPVRSGSIDLVVAYNSLMDFDDLPSAVDEIARVLSDEGFLCICITHPVEYSGGFDGDDVDAPYLLTHYLDTRSFDDTFTRDGITMRFRGWARPMQEYFSALFDAGFVVDALQEPVPNISSGRYERWHRFPMFLHLRAIKRRA